MHIKMLFKKKEDQKTFSNICSIFSSHFYSGYIGFYLVLISLNSVLKRYTTFIL